MDKSLEIVIICFFLALVFAVGLAVAAVLDTINYFTEQVTETIITTTGTFDGIMHDSKGKEYYHFKSHDNEVWWLLTEKEMGFIPDENVEYVLTYDNNGTTKTNKPCDCESELECECEVYDDKFISIVKGR